MISNIELHKLKKYDRNPKDHPHEQITRIASSIREFGFNVPILLTSDLEVIAGHGRLLAAESLGLDSIPALFVDHLTPEQIRLYRIADNKCSESGWIDDVLKQELLDLSMLGADLSLSGFSDAEIDSFLDDISPFHSGQTDPDDVPPLPENPLTQKGDIWILGNHKFICGDSTDASVFSSLFQNEKASLLFTDPPYNVDYGDKIRYLNNGDRSNVQHKDIKNDHLPDAEFDSFIMQVFINIFAFMDAGASYYIFHSDSFGHVFRNSVLKCGFFLKQVLVWVKNSSVLSRQDYHWQHEPILYGWKPGKAHTFLGGRKQKTVIQDNSLVRVSGIEDGILLSIGDGIDSVSIKVPSYELILEAGNPESSIWRYDRPKVNDIHPTMKPVELIRRAVLNSTHKNQIVMDCFLGSGATLIACEMTGRRCFGIEFEPVYCDSIIERWQNFTGQTAILQASGLSYNDLKNKA